MKQSFREYVEGKLPREDDKELFRSLLKAYDRGGPEEVKITIQEIIKNLMEA